jgi:alpha-amylase
MRRTALIINLMAVLSLALAGCNPSTPVEQSGLRSPADAGWWNEAVIYEIFVRSFYDSDGDGIGDLAGILEKLDYLNDGDPTTGTDLGVTALWLMPIYPTNTYHGYDVIDYRNINPDYGTLEDFKALVEAAHQRGMRVILDLVINHTSSVNTWFLASQDPDSPYRDWYRWSASDPGEFSEDGRSVWHKLAGAYYYGYFGAGMPDLNYRNEEVTSEMLDIARFWAVDMGVDGFRIDAARYLIEDEKVISNAPEAHAWFADFYSKLRRLKPDIYLVGEVWSYATESASYVTGQEMTQSFDFVLSSAIISSVNNHMPSRLNAILERDYPLFDYGNMGVFLTNHDMPRSMSQLGGYADKARMAAFLLLTAPGTPYIYYGEELGMLGQKPDELIRTPMQWTGGAYCGFSSAGSWEPVNPDCPEVNLEAQHADPQSLWNTYAALIRMRQSNPALSDGELFLVHADNPAIYSALRVSQGQALLLVANLGLKDLNSVGLVLEKGPLTGQYKLTPIHGEAQDSQLIATAKGGFTLFDSVRGIGGLQAVVYLLEPIK